MTPRRWMVAGWALLTTTVLLAVLSLTEAFVSIRPVGQNSENVAVPVLMSSIVLGVLAGVAFFTGLACFFWSAALQRRRRLDEILRRLEARTGTIRPF